MSHFYVDTLSHVVRQETGSSPFPHPGPGGKGTGRPRIVESWGERERVTTDKIKLCRLLSRSRK